jgi:hypothetical protein
VKTATNKRLLIPESHDDSNRCTPYKGKLDQHTTRIPRSVCIWSQTICIWRGQRIATFRESPTDLDGSHCSQEKGLPTQSTARRLTDPWVCIQFLSQANKWSSRFKPSFCRWQATRLTGPISLTCGRYVQYLLTGANPSVFNRHSRILQPCRCWLATYYSPTFPTNSPPLFT